MMQVTYENAMRLTAACFDSTSDRLIHLAASTAITYLAGVQGWNTEKKIPAKVIQEQIVEVFQTTGHKRTSAYTFAKIGFKLAAYIQKGDKVFRETLKTSDLTEAAGLVVAQIKAGLQALDLAATMDNLKLMLDPPKSSSEKTTKSAAERVLSILNSDKAEFTDIDLSNMLAVIRGKLAARAKRPDMIPLPLLSQAS